MYRIEEKVVEEAIRVLKPHELLIVYDQLSYIDRVLCRDREVFVLLRDNIRVLSYKYIFGGHFYIAVCSKS